jgi:hypothetical protein
MLLGLETTPLIETVEYLKTSVQWSRYFKLISMIGDSLNSHKNRFDKSDLLEHSIEIFSEGKIKWIDDFGADHILPNGERLEMKYVFGCLQTKNRKSKKTVGSIKLMNSLGTCTRKNLPSDYADYLLISDYHIVCLIDKNTLSQYTISRGDGMYAENIPFSQTCVVAKASSQILLQEKIFDYADQKKQMQKKFVEQVI